MYNFEMYYENDKPLLTESESLEVLKKDVIKLQSKMPLKVNTSIVNGEDHFSVTFTVKHQHFHIETTETELEAVWFQKQFLVAINNLIEMIKEDK